MKMPIYDSWYEYERACLEAEEQNPWHDDVDWWKQQNEDEQWIEEHEHE